MNEKKKEISRIVSALQAEDEFLITTHVHPDGDGLGAMLAFDALLAAMGKARTMAVVDTADIMVQYTWLPGTDRIVSVAGASGRNMISLDVANKARLGEMAGIFDNCRVTINIDHHPDNPEFAGINWVDKEKSSTSEMVYDLWTHFGLPLSEKAALCIYVGMLTDTGRWQYSNTGAETLRKASLLVGAGVKPIEVYRQVYENNSVEWIKLLAVGLRKSVFDNELGLAYATISQADLKETGAAMSDTENLVDRLRSVAGIRAAMILKETRQGDVKVSLRSQEPVDVGALAREFGGGGHKHAAGFTAKDTSENIISNVKRWLTAFF